MYVYQNVFQQKKKNLWTIKNLKINLLIQNKAYHQE